MIKIAKKYVIELELDTENAEKLSRDLDILTSDDYDISSVTRDLADVLRASI